MIRSSPEQFLTTLITMDEIETPGAPMRPPRLWTHLVVALFVTAALLAGYGWILADRASRPIGEGALFLDDVRGVVERVETSERPPDETVRSIRNDLEVEAVSVVDGSGEIRVSTSASLVGERIDNPVLAAGIAGDETDGRFAAVASRLPDAIEIDGVATWDASDVLYQVAHPLDGGGAVVVAYDMSELLARRSAGRGIPDRSVDLFALAGLIGLGGAGALMARARAARTYAVFTAESRLLREQAETLRIHNAELEEAREQAERALELAEEKNRIRSEFVLMINHELRTPLTGVVSGARLLSDLVDDELGREILDDVIGGAERLEDMIGEMLVVARMENRGLFVEPVPTVLDEILTELEARRSGARITLAPGVDPQEKILTDATTLPMIVTSLVENAFTHGASDVVVQTVDRLPFEPVMEVGERPERAVFLVVVDNGPGIDPAFLPRAFEKFEKQSFSSGTGLGLYMAKMMVEALGGSISVLTGPRGTAMAIGVPAVSERELVS